MRKHNPLGFKLDLQRFGGSPKTLPRLDLQRFADGDTVQTDNTTPDGAHTEPVSDNGAHTDTEPSEKTFTQSELDSIVRDRIAREKQKLEQEKQRFEQEKELAKLSEKERAEKEFQLEKERFEQERIEFEKNKLKLDTIKDLGERNLSPEFVDFVIGHDVDSTHERIRQFEDLFNKSLEKALEDRLKGKTPTKTTGNVGLTKEDFDKMGYTERVQLKKTNPDLYKTLSETV